MCTGCLVDVPEVVFVDIYVAALLPPRQRDVVPEFHCSTYSGDVAEDLQNHAKGTLEKGDLTNPTVERKTGAMSKHAR